MNTIGIIKKVSIAISQKDPSVLEVLREVEHFLTSKGVQIKGKVDMSQIKSSKNDKLPSIDFEGDIIISVGGDGTVLRTLLYSSDKEMPVLSIGLGELNFISSTDKQRFREDLEKLVRGRFYIRREMRLDTFVPGIGYDLPPVLNEVVYHSSNIGKTLLPKIYVEIGGYRTLLWSVKSDGVLVSTPIGSTAYSFAAGGSVIDTDLEAILVTPLVPTTKIPSYVINPDAEVHLTADKSRSKPTIILDGQITINLDWEEEVVIRRSPYYAYIVTFDKDVNLRRMKRVAERYGGVRE